MAVLVYVENVEGSFKKSTYELITYARDLAEKLGQELVGVSIGEVADDTLAGLGKYGLPKVYSITNDELKQFRAQPYTDALNVAIEKSGASTIVMANSYNGKAMGPRIAVKRSASIATAVISLPDTDNGFSVKRTVFSNKGFALVNLTGETRVLTLNGNSYKVAESPVDCTVESVDASVDVKGGVNVTEVRRQTGKIPLTEAELVVSAGRGLKGPENWDMIEELADLIGAATACSKPVSDMEWRPHGEHVGQTGITISPNLYIAIGISGAIQHLAGVSSSKVICVINKDPEAPFFKSADYGIVGDAFEVVPKLVEAARQLD